MSLKEKLFGKAKPKNELKPVPLEGHFALAQSDHPQVLTPNKFTEMGPYPQYAVTSLGFRAAREDKLDIQILWDNGYYVCFEWGMIEQFELNQNERAKRDHYVKVKKFGLGLTQANLINHGAQYQIRDCPISLSTDLRQVFVEGHLLLSWVPQA